MPTSSTTSTRSRLSFRRLLNIVPGNGMVLLNGDDPNCIDVAGTCPAPIVEVGFSPNAANVIKDVSYGPAGSGFRLFDTEFSIPLIGEYNVRNAAMAISAARFYGVELPVIRDAVAAFTGVRRRQEVRGEVRGIKIIDDFGHHPTAIRETLRGLRHQYANGRIWAVFEPRSNTTRRSVFQKELAVALGVADGVILAKVARLEQIPEAERLNPEKVVEAIRASGREAYYEPDVPGIIRRLKPLVREKTSSPSSATEGSTASTRNS